MKNECSRKHDVVEYKTNTGANQLDPSNLYSNMESAMKLSRLEDPSILTVALRHITRTNHEKGINVSFPQIEAIDRITLKSNNLPTKPEDLLLLIKKVFARREEKLDLQQIYKQFVRAHGRIVF